jgi:hypothetical protein
VVGTPVPHPLVVEALNSAGDPVEGAVIVFRFLDRPSGAEIAPPVSETGPSGLAEVAVTLGKPAGDQPVEARLDSPQREVSVRFLLTAIPSNTGGGDNPPPPPDDDGDDDRGGGSSGGGGGGAEDDDSGKEGGKDKGKGKDKHDDDEDD